MEPLTAVKLIGLPFVAYLAGSIPCGLVLTRLFTSVDIRKAGSGNVGATNVRRTVSLKLGILTLIGDALKGAIPVYIATAIADNNNLWHEIYISIVALSSFSGHLYPLYTKFKNGGKGVATAAGCFLIISTAATFVALSVFILFACWRNHVSSGSLAAAAILPVAVRMDTCSAALTVCALIIAISIYIRHKENIKRLLSGREPVIWKKN